MDVSYLSNTCVGPELRLDFPNNEILRRYLFIYVKDFKHLKKLMFLGIYIFYIINGFYGI